MGYRISCGDSLDMLSAEGSNSVDAVVTDPPYGLGFMGKGWDRGLPNPLIWAECLRILKPGSVLVAFGGTRTFHRLWCVLEDAGFEIRDTLCWLYGQGFPKSLDVGKALDKGHERPVVGVRRGVGGNSGSGVLGWNSRSDGVDRGLVKETEPVTDLAKRYDGWGTALKPAFEPICLARKPLCGTVAENIGKWGVGGLNIGGCRVGHVRWSRPAMGGSPNRAMSGGNCPRPATSHDGGRYPSNVLIDEVAAEMLDSQTGVLTSGKMTPSRHKRTKTGRDGYRGNAYGSWNQDGLPVLETYGDSGGASRFFYCAKASRAERERGLESNPLGDVKNNHPTVKPVSLMRWLCRLVTPPNASVCDPFMGSGTTGVAAVLEGFDFMGVELDEGYVEIARARIEDALLSAEEERRRGEEQLTMDLGELHVGRD